MSEKNERKPTPVVRQTSEFFSGFRVEAGFDFLDTVAFAKCLDVGSCAACPTPCGEVEKEKN